MRAAHLVVDPVQRERQLHHGPAPEWVDDQGEGDHSSASEQGSGGPGRRSAVRGPSRVCHGRRRSDVGGAPRDLAVRRPPAVADRAFQAFDLRPSHQRGRDQQNLVLVVMRGF